MFMEGLGTNARSGVQGVGGVKKRDVPISFLSQKLQSDPCGNLRNGGWGFGLPSVLNGNPVSRAMPVNANDCDSDSDSEMDLCSDSEDEVYGGRYSVLASPQDDKFPTTMQKQANYGCDWTRSNFSSSSETIQLKQGRQNAVGRPGRTEELSDSATSTEVSFTQFRSNNGGVGHRGTHTMDGYSASVTSKANVERIAKQDYGRGLQDKKLFNDDIPSAPPFVGSVSTFRAHGTPGFANSNGSATTRESRNTTVNRISSQSVRTTAGFEVNASPVSLPARLPTFHASGQGTWSAVISYDACVRLCLHSWARGHCMEAPYFLNDECALLREAFGLRKVLLQPEEELLAKQSSELVSEGAAPKSRKVLCKMKMQLRVRKVKMGLDPPTGCSFSSLKPQMNKLGSLHSRLSNFKSTLHSEWEAMMSVRAAPHIPSNGSFSHQSLAYVHASTQYIKQVSGLLKTGVTSLRNGSSSYEVVQERYSCLLRLKSSSEEDAVQMQPGSGETHVFFPDSLSDDLIIEVQDSKGQYKGRVQAQVASIADDQGETIRWWPIYHEPEHELVGRIQLSINSSNSLVENNHLKCGSVAETVAYDFVLEVAMKVLHIQQRNLLLHGPWKWLVAEFATYYGVSDAYTKLRYLSYIMDVATPTEDCLALAHDFLLPAVVMKAKNKSALSHQENRMLGEIADQVQQILTLVFENYKSLDDSPSGIMDVFEPATGLAAPALAPAVKLYSLLHDILSPEAQLKLCRYFQAAAKKRSRRHLTETDEFILNRDGSMLLDPVTLSTSYQKMKSFIFNIRNEIFTDIEIHQQDVLPSFLDLPHLSSAIYSVELCSRLRAFLVACPPPGPSPPVAEFVIATADFQRDLACWNINPVKGGVDAKELFQAYITLWIKEKRLALLELCKLDKVKWSGVRTQHSTTPFVDDMYDRLKETLDEYEFIICRWPEYICYLEKVIADIEKAIVEALDKQYADVLAPLKDNLTSKIYGLKYVQKFAKRSDTYVVPDALGILLNSMKRMLDLLRPKIETHLQSWSSCISDDGGTIRGDCFSEVTVMLRAKFRSYLHAVVEKLVENTRVQRETNLKKIIEDPKETVLESDVQSRIQPLRDMLKKTIHHLHTVVDTHVFIAICRGFWDRMGQDILHFLENRRENSSYKGLRITVSILDDIYASEMQQLVGNALQEKDLKPPRSIIEVQSLLCKDAVNYKDSYY